MQGAAAAIRWASELRDRRRRTICPCCFRQRHGGGAPASFRPPPESQPVRTRTTTAPKGEGRPLPSSSHRNGYDLRACVEVLLASPHLRAPGEANGSYAKQTSYGGKPTGRR